MAACTAKIDIFLPTELVNREYFVQSFFPDVT